MKDIKEQLKRDLKEAMLKKDSFKRDTIRFLNSAIKQIEVDERRELSDDDIVKIIQKSIKQREDAAKQYKDANRDDLYEKEIKEANILKEYLPKQLEIDEIKEIVSDIINETGANSLKDMGNIMKIATQKIGTRSDGKTISSVVKELLS